MSPQLLQFSRDFYETFQLLLPWPEDAHILSRSCSTDFYQSYGPLTIFQQWVLSLQLLSQFPVDFSETFQLLFSWPEEDHIIPRSCLTAFYQTYGPLSVLAILSREVLVSATPPPVFKGFLWNFPDTVAMTWRWSYFIEVMLNWFLSELWPFNYCSIVSLVSTTPLTVFSGFQWNLPFIIPNTWRGSYYTKVTLDCFLPELWPFVSFSHFVNRGSCLGNSSYSFQGILMKLSSYCSMTWRWSYFIEVMLSWFLSELWPFNNFSIVSLVSATLHAVFNGF